MIKGSVPYRKREWAWCRHEHSEGDLGFLAGLGWSFRWQHPLPSAAAGSRFAPACISPSACPAPLQSDSLSPAGRSGTVHRERTSSLRNRSMICAVARSNSKYSPGALALNSCKRSFAAFKSSPASSQMNSPSSFLLKRSSVDRINSPFSTSATN